MIKCKHCTREIDEAIYVGNSRGLDEVLLHHYQQHQNDKIIRDNYISFRSISDKTKEKVL